MSHIGRHYTNRKGSFATAMREARVAFWRRLIKAHPGKSTRQLAKVAGVSAATVSRMLREAGFTPILDARWQRRGGREGGTT